MDLIDLIDPCEDSSRLNGLKFSDPILPVGTFSAQVERNGESINFEIFRMPRQSLNFSDNSDTLLGMTSLQNAKII